MTSFSNRGGAVNITSVYHCTYFPGSGISWKAQKEQVNITITSTFWLTKTVFRITEKLKTRTFS